MGLIDSDERNHWSAIWCPNQIAYSKPTSVGVQLLSFYSFPFFSFILFFLSLFLTSISLSSTLIKHFRKAMVRVSVSICNHQTASSIATVTQSNLFNFFSPQTQASTSSSIAKWCPSDHFLLSSWLKSLRYSFLETILETMNLWLCNLAHSYGLTSSSSSLLAQISKLQLANESLFLVSVILVWEAEAEASSSSKEDPPREQANSMTN